METFVFSDNGPPFVHISTKGSFYSWIQGMHSQFSIIDFDTAQSRVGDVTRLFNGGHRHGSARNTPSVRIPKPEKVSPSGAPLPTAAGRGPKRCQGAP